jgi:D-lactate dehydrogenase
MWTVAARRWSAASGAASAALSVAHALPAQAVKSASSISRTLAGPENIPQWTPDLPAGGQRRRYLPRDEQPEILYFPSCTSAIFGAHDGVGVADAFVTLCRRAGVRLAVPAGIDGLCCAMPWRSKGFANGSEIMRQRVADAVSQSCGVVLVVDAASCTEGAVGLLQGLDVTVVDVVSYTLTTLAPRLTVNTKIGRLVLHPTCASTRLGISSDLSELAALLAETVTIPT